MPQTTTKPPELLYLLHSDPEELAEALRVMRAADIAESLRSLPADAAAKVMAALPFETAVQVFDEPELTHHRCEIVTHMDPLAAGRLIEAMSADQQADLLREVKGPHRERVLQSLSPDTRGALATLLAYKPESAGGIMTTEFVSMPATWTVAEALQHVREVGRAKETIYAIYVLEPGTDRLLRTVSLRELILAQPDAIVGAVGDGRALLTVRATTDREDVAKLISKYNLLAAPVVDEGQRVIGIVTVDDVIDASSASRRRTCRSSAAWRRSTGRTWTSGWGRWCGSAPGGCARSSCRRCSPPPRCSTTSTRSRRPWCSACSSRSS